MAQTLSKKYSHSDIETKWAKKWCDEDHYAYDSSVDRENTFVVDTPPPTVSGQLHMGHLFSYTHTDVLVRLQRMQGKNIFYPMGFDDNGLPTERRVQRLHGVKCHPSLAFDETLSFEVSADKKEKKKIEYQDISRKNFLALCLEQTQVDREAYKKLWSRLGLSVDWNQSYSTINDHCRKVSQESFLDLFKKSVAYNAVEPVLWDTGFQTAIAQAEIEDREKQGFFHDIEFKVESEEEYFTISTTRPELLPACIAVVAHPDDERFQKYFGKKARLPLFHSLVPIMPATHVEKDKGTGIMMICTFGDVADVDFWKGSELPLKHVISEEGKFLDVKFGEAAFQSEEPAEANKNYAALSGNFVKVARKNIVELLSEENSGWQGKPALIGELKKTTQIVKFYEKGDFPLEYVPARQWFLNVLDHREDLLKFSEKLIWKPDHMALRLKQWIEGLNQNWCLSRQRFFGVPIPVWYELSEDGSVDYTKKILPKVADLPIDPMADIPEGFQEADRGKAGGFVGDHQVLDTWATSSMTPQINSHWSSECTQDRHDQLFPADLRPQGHEIIRTWTFYTMVKAYFHEKKLPWSKLVISGWVVNPDGSKMSKSKGKTVTPEELIENYGADALRYWAAKVKLGADSVYDEDVFKLGNRLSTKLFNVSKYVFMQRASLSELGDDLLPYIKNEVDLSWLMKMQNALELFQKEMSEDRYHKILLDSESLFWDFCNHYVELTKVRAYQEAETEGGLSARATLLWSLETFLKLFAPFMPYITQEIWSCLYEDSSIHFASWPQLSTSEKRGVECFELSQLVLEEVRTRKSTAQKSLKHPLSSLKITCNKSEESLLRAVDFDIRAAAIFDGKIDFQVLAESSEIQVELSLASD